MPTKNFSAYLFLGEEDFLKEEAVKKLTSQFLDTRTKDLNYSVFYAKEKNLGLKEMLGTLNTSPFLSKKRLVVLKNANSLAAAGKESVLFYLNNPKESSLFVIESPDPVIKGGFLLEVSKRAHLVYFRRLADAGLSAWLVKKAGAAEKKISGEAVKAIKENLPNDLRILYSNMENIILYTGERPLITKEDVEKVIGISPTHTAFDLIASMEKKDARKSLRIFLALKKDRKRETELLGLLAWNARMLLRIKESRGNIAMRRNLGLNPRTFDRIARHAAVFKRKEILVLLDEILISDLDIKSGSPPTAVIERLIVKMCS